MASKAKVLGGTFVAPEGGDLEVDPDKPMDVPESVQMTDYGPMFGPLEISAYPDSTARVGGLTFSAVEGLFDGLFDHASDGLFGASLLGLGLAAPRDRDDTSDGISRRSFLQAAGAGALAVGYGTQTASAATPTPTPTPTETDGPQTKAEFEAIANPQGIRTRVFDRVDGVLPTGEPYYTWVDGSNYGQFFAGSESDYGDVLPEKVGTVTVGQDGAAGGFFEALTSDKTQVYDRLSLSQNLGDAQTGEQVAVSTNDIIVEQAQAAGGDDMTLAVNGVSLPHEQETTDADVGYYSTQNGKLIIRVGPSSPSGGSATLVLFADTTDELLDDINRGVR